MSKKRNLADAMGKFDNKFNYSSEINIKTTKINSKPKSRLNKRVIAGHFNKEVSRQLKLIGIEQDRSMQDMLQEAINDFFIKNNKSAIA